MSAIKRGFGGLYRGGEYLADVLYAHVRTPTYTGVDKSGGHRERLEGVPHESWQLIILRGDAPGVGDNVTLRLEDGAERYLLITGHNATLGSYDATSRSV